MLYYNHKTTNTSKYNSEGLMKQIFTKEDILKSGAKDTRPTQKSNWYRLLSIWFKRSASTIFMGDRIKSYINTFKWYCN